MIAVAPNGNAVTFSWAELDSGSGRAAAVLREAGIRASTVVAVALPARAEHVVATIAAWKIGATAVALDPTAPDDAANLREAAPDALVIGAREWAEIQKASRDATPVAVDPAAEPLSASLSGGTTGKPRIIVRREPWVFDPDQLPSAGDLARGVRTGQVQLVTLPLYHAGFGTLYYGLALDHTIVLTERFVPTQFVRLVNDYRVAHFRTVPTQMRMISELPGISRSDLSPIESVHHTSAPCPRHVKLKWFELVGPEKVFEIYGSMERLGMITIGGQEWLRHPGSVGKPTSCDVRILDDDGRPLPPGHEGHVYIRSESAFQPTYLGTATELPERNGFLSVGDVGYLDDDGYLYLVGRVGNDINVGGVNVYPIEIEHVLLEMPEVEDAVVSGRPHEYLGEAPHARVAPVVGTSPDVRELEAYCRRRLAATKVPLSYEVVEDVGRLPTGKVRLG